MRVQSLGHVVLKVRNRDRSETFYSKLLGIPVISRISDPVHMTFFSLGNHHDFAVLEVREHAPTPDPLTTGLDHVAFKIGDSLEEFSAAKADLEAAGIVLFEAERTFTRSLHVQDPDGNQVELYIDTSDTWKTGASSSS